MTREQMSVKEVITALLETSDNDAEVQVEINGIPGFSVTNVVDQGDDIMTIQVGKPRETVS